MPNVKPAEAPVVETPEAPVVLEEPTATVEPDEAPEAEPTATVDRFETFEATRPDGTIVIIERNIDTGEQTVTE